MCIDHRDMSHVKIAFRIPKQTMHQRERETARYYFDDATCDPNFNSSKISSRQIFKTIFRSIEQEMWPLEHPYGISLFF